MFFQRKKSEASFNVDPVIERVTSVIGSGINWRGDLQGRGGIRIEGTFEGELKIDGLVVVGETGRVTCNLLIAEALIVAGQVRANIQTKRLEIRSTGRIWGDVVTTSFSSEDGAFLRGQMRMEEKLELGFQPQTQAEDAAASEASAASAEAQAEVVSSGTTPILVRSDSQPEPDETGKIPAPWAD